VIDEALLERALRDEAGTYEPPPGGPDRILDAYAASGGPRPGVPVRRVKKGWLVAAAGVAAVLALPSLGRLAPTGSSSSTTSGSPATFQDKSATGQRNSLDSEQPTGGTTTGSAGSGGGSAPDTPKAPGADSAKVIRTGTVAIEVPRDRVAGVLRDLPGIAVAHRGYVAESSSRSAGDDAGGYVTLRVPVADFERVAAEVGRLGKVRTTTANGEDVTDQVTDTAARLKSLTATRAQLQTLMARAKDVGEVLAVQTRITEVQTQIEQLEAKQASLADKTSYGTLRVEVAVSGALAEAPHEATGFGKAWRTARDAFVGGFEGLVAASGTIAFLLLLGAALVLLGRLAYRAFVRRIV
jgi:hypothetical protein